jgi:ABC-type lipoprotein export system ATPase subunit
MPVIELRLDKFGGTAHHLSKVNFHVIFSDEIKPDIIQQQFISALNSGYRLSPLCESLGLEWRAVPTPDSLTDLGQMIVESVPDDKKSEFRAPLLEGFNNLTFSLDAIGSILSSPYFRGRCLTAVGKTEWWNIKWNDYSIADKKNIINKAHFVFMSAESVADCRKAKQHLTDSGVNDKLLDCSDAHYFSASPHKDRLGRCYSWIKADPTFRGLAMALYESDTRTFLGDAPPKSHVVDSNKTKFIRSVRVGKRADSTLDEIWYDDVDITFNHDMVAIIGNRGTGKSALSEVIGLLGNTRNDGDFSFLCRERFRTPVYNKSKHFEATLLWESGTEEATTLDALTDHALDELIKYIPQGFFDKVCNQLSNGEETDFDKELKKAIFSHVDPADRLGQDTLDDLLDYKTEETHEAIQILIEQLHELNQQIIGLEEELEDDYRLQTTNSLQIRTRELVAHEESKPQEVAKPDNQLQQDKILILQDIEDENNKRTELASELASSLEAKQKNALIVSKADRVLKRIENFKKEYEIFKMGITPELKYLGIDFDQVVQLAFSTAPVEATRSQAEKLRVAAVGLSDPTNPDSLVFKIGEIDQKIENLQTALDEPQRKYQTYQTELQEWKEKKQELIGDEYTYGSLEYYKRLLREIETAPTRLDAAKAKRLSCVAEIFGQIGKLADTYRKLYAPVQQFISSYSIAKDVFQMEFGVSIVNTDFHRRFFDWIGRGVVGSFYGTVEGDKKLRDILEKYDFNNESAVIAFLDEVMDHLLFDRRDPDVPKAVRLADQLKKDRTTISLYDYIFSLEYLRPRYVLKLAGKELGQLSPGERGILLLAFYLLVDKEIVPLVIDQPEENLDNQTLYEFLVKCIQDAKKRRQVVIVTHNPNLAVVCDAEQIICCSMDKIQGNRIEYTSGAIENPEINRRIIDILEGTKPAFDNRKLKYEPPIWSA